MPNYSDLLQFITYVFSFEHLIELRIIALSREYDIRANVIRTILTHLELKGLIKSKAPIYTEYKFVPLKSSKEILSLISDSDRYLVTTIFKNITKRSKYFEVNLDHLINVLSLSRTDIINVLNMLNDLNMIELKTKGLLNQYEYIKKLGDVNSISKEIYNFLKIREKADLNRVSQVVDLINANECQSKMLSHYFGENLAVDCGTCSYCKSKKNLNLIRKNDQFQFSDKQIQWLNDILNQESDYLKRPNILTKILVGINSPIITKLKLNKLNIFGKLSYVPYHVIQNNIKRHFSKIIEFD